MSPAERSRSQTSRRISRRRGAARASKTESMAINLVYTKMTAEGFTGFPEIGDRLIDGGSGEGLQSLDSAGDRLFGDGEGEAQVALPLRAEDDAGHGRDPDGAQELLGRRRGVISEDGRDLWEEVQRRAGGVDLEPRRAQAGHERVAPAAVAGPRLDQEIVGELQRRESRPLSRGRDSVDR